LSIDSLASAIRKDFTTLGMPDIVEMAIVSSTGKVMYSDLGKSTLARVSPFYKNMLLMSPGDNISLNMDSARNIIVSRVSNSAILVVLTNKKVGIVLTKMKGVAEKFGKLLDEVTPQQELSAAEAPPSPQVEVETIETVAPPSPPSDNIMAHPIEQEEQLEQAVAQISAAVSQAPAPAPAVPIIVNEAKAIIEEGKANNVTLRALGGTAIAIHCPSARSKALMRDYPDIDLAGHAKEAKGITKAFGDLGFLPNKRFNALHGAKRLKFAEENSETDVDVFLDVFEMCHKLDFKDRLELDEYTISLADLLMTKLQIVELNEKDVRDVIALVLDHNFGPDQDQIDYDYIAKLCGDDWGLWKTLSNNAQNISGQVDNYAITEDEKKKAKLRLEVFLKRLEDEPKGTRWKLRARVGESRKWYETVEEVVR
jgi:hypothetical protein